MKAIVLAAALCLALAPLPLVAQQQAPDEGGDINEGMDLLGQGMDLFLRGLMDEISPELERLGPELRNFARDMGPLLGQLAELVGEIDAYHPPERLPNGDIILRRKLPSEVEPEPLAPPGEGEIDI